MARVHMELQTVGLVYRELVVVRENAGMAPNPYDPGTRPSCGWDLNRNRLFQESLWSPELDTPHPVNALVLGPRSDDDYAASR